jgi:pyridoxal phosphate enzyme (YggS family)
MPGLQQRLSNIHSRITQSARRAGRDPSEIQLIAVTKNVPVEAIREAISLGIRHIGENKVQEALAKWKELRRTMGERRWTREEERQPTTHDPRLTTIQWHFIGHLQTNKVRDAVEIFDWIHSIDSLRLAEKIHQEAEKIKKVMPVLIEVNVSGESTKHGISPNDLPELVNALKSLSSVHVEGFMTMAPLVSDSNQARPYFQQLVRLRQQILEQFAFMNPSPPPPQLPNALAPFHLSMGMSQDFEVAIEEGATMVRIGTAIFGDRNR